MADISRATCDTIANMNTPQNPRGCVAFGPPSATTSSAILSPYSCPDSKCRYPSTLSDATKPSHVPPDTKKWLATPGAPKWHFVSSLRYKLVPLQLPFRRCQWNCLCQLPEFDLLVHHLFPMEHQHSLHCHSKVVHTYVPGCSYTFSWQQ